MVCDSIKMLRARQTWAGSRDISRKRPLSHMEHRTKFSRTEIRQPKAKMEPNGIHLLIENLSLHKAEL